jgi:hypothetical protein
MGYKIHSIIILIDSEPITNNYPAFQIILDSIMQAYIKFYHRFPCQQIHPFDSYGNLIL